MRKGKLLRIVFLTIVMIVIFSIGKKVSANSIEKISMDISLDYAGDATITEVWECYTNQGTEVYHPYYNLGESTIRNLTVIDNGRQYTTLSSWDTEGSISEKAYKCGLNYVTNGVEICWGMNSYTNHTNACK